ncbi:MAG: hypothetical protein HEQ23_15290 [Tepidisphaera sp.]
MTIGALAVTCGAAAAFAQPQPVAWYQFEGSLVDSGPLAINGVAEGPVSFAPSPNGHGLLVRDGRVSLGNTSFLHLYQPMALTALIRAEPNSMYGTFISHGAGGFIFYVRPTDGRPTTSLSFGRQGYGSPGPGGVVSTDGAADPNPIVVGRFHAVAAVYDASVVSLYIDGVRVVTGPLAANFFDVVNSLRIGGDPTIPSLEQFRGVIDEVRFFNQALTPCEIELIAMRDLTLSVLNASVCPNGTANFAVSPFGVGPFTYAWRKEGNPIDPLTNPSAATATLVLTNVGPADEASYDCIVTNACGSVTSDAATLTICAADFNCDGFLDFFDYDDYVNCFETGACGGGGGGTADFNGDDFVDFFDYDAFVVAFETGC